MMIRLINQSNRSLCSMQDCCREEGKLLIQINTSFPNISEVTDHQEVRQHQGIIKLFEVNVHETPSVFGTIAGQLYEKELVTIQEETEEWLLIQKGETQGWIHHTTLKKYEQVQQAEQLQGETHEAFICDACFNKLNWQDFYVDEIEPNLAHHVTDNYLLSYVETAIALEGEDVTFEEYKKRILDEIHSGEHGLPLRFNEEEIVNKYYEKRSV